MTSDTSTSNTSTSDTAGAAVTTSVPADHVTRRPAPVLTLAGWWSWGRRLVAPAAVFALIIAAWYGASYLLLNADQRFLLPPPHRVAAIGFLDWNNLSDLLAALARTAKVAAVGLVGAALVGVGAGVVMDQARWLEQALMPWAILLQTMPIFALAPLFGFWWGFGLFPRVMVCVLFGLFPILTSTLFGLRSADPQLHELFALHQVSRWVRLWRLQLPAALPSVLNGLRTSAGACVIGAVVGDLFFASGPPGLGILIQLYLQRLATEQMFAAAILAAAFGVAVFAAFGALARHTAGRWHPAAGRRT
jgi:NitT/TauT family transport system permease protein